MMTRQLTFRVRKERQIFTTYGQLFNESRYEDDTERDDHDDNVAKRAKARKTIKYFENEATDEDRKYVFSKDYSRLWMIYADVSGWVWRARSHSYIKERY